MSSPTRAETIWLDGEWLRWEEAKVHLLTHTLHYGLGVFEGTRVYGQSDGGTAIFRLPDHLRRLEQSGHILQVDIPCDREAIFDATLELLLRNNMRSSGYIRHLAFIGQGVMGLHPRDNPVKLAIMTWPWGAYLGEEGLAKGVRCKIASYSRHYPNSTMVKAKACGNYVVSILAKREAIRSGYDEALLLDTQGFVAEGSGENIFIVRDGRLRTPPPAAILQGITRDTVMALAARNGLAVEEAHLSRDELYVADEVFLTGTAAEITPVREVDDRRIGAGRPGPITQLIQSQFFQAVRGELPGADAWLTRVPFAAEVPVPQAREA